MIGNWWVNYLDVKVWIIVYSNGGLVFWWYIEKLGGFDYVDCFFFIVLLWDGVLIVMCVLFNGLEIFFWKCFNVFFNIL